MIDRFSQSGISDHHLSIPEDGHWFSEARLPSAFLPRFRADPLAESHTNADGVTGHYQRLIITYQATSRELEALKNRWVISGINDIRSDEGGKFVLDMEQVNSVENQAWMSQWTEKKEGHVQV